jgi:hypothetical protein
VSPAIVPQEQIIYPNLPLAIYRELAAHLQQVPGIKTELLAQNAPTFDYAHSQIGALIIGYPLDINTQDKQQVEAILSYYARRYGAYQRQMVEI